MSPVEQQSFHSLPLSHPLQEASPLLSSHWRSPSAYRKPKNVRRELLVKSSTDAQTTQGWSVTHAYMHSRSGYAHFLLVSCEWHKSHMTCTYSLLPVKLLKCYLELTRWQVLNKHCCSALQAQGKDKPWNEEENMFFGLLSHQVGEVVAKLTTEYTTWITEPINVATRARERETNVRKQEQQRAREREGKVSGSKYEMMKSKLLHVGSGTHVFQDILLYVSTRAICS